MRNLVDRSVYDREDEVHFQAYLRRAPRVTGAYMAVTYAVGALVILLLLGDLDLRTGVIALVASAWGGAAVAAAVRRWTFPHQHRELRAIFERVYDGDPALVPPPPPDDQYPLRLPCGLLLSWRIVMGGVLYLGPAGFLFVPHLRNAEALRDAVRMEPVRTHPPAPPVRDPLARAALARTLPRRAAGGVAGRGGHVRRPRPRPHPAPDGGGASQMEVRRGILTTLAPLPAVPVPSSGFRELIPDPNDLLPLPSS